jgi:hypothetical protein
MKTLKIKNRFSFPTVYQIFIALVVLVTASVSAVSLLSKTSDAASLSSWNPGRIIDDSVMTNKNAMNVSQIQSFLNGKVPTCDTNGQQNSEMNNAGVPDYNGNGSIQRWEWGKYKYNQTTFPCLKSYKQNNISAAQLIYNAAQTYSINPRVLIVLLQKEQGLVTDTWPLNIQYRSATGYGCPDGAACDSQYYGLTNQLNWAAKMFHAIETNNPNWYTPYVLGNNYIRYSPISSCGGTTVNIINRATQALYNYTPYQPNAAALQAGYGAGNSCSSYGNRNFFLYYNDWFGATVGKAVYSWSLVSQEAYSDSGYTTKVGNASLSMQPGSSLYLKVVVKNTGNQTWYSDFARLGTANTTDRASVFADGWPNASRAAGMQEDSVVGGENATFQFKITAPPALGTYNESFGVLLEGQRWISGSLTYNITVASASPYYYLSPVSFRVYTDEARRYEVRKEAVTTYVGSKLYVVATFKNQGNQDFSATATKIAPTNPTDRNSLFHNSTWLAANRIVNPEEGTIHPGETGTFKFSMTTPAAGIYAEQFGVVLEGNRWLTTNFSTMNITDNVRPPAQLNPGGTLQNSDDLLSSDDRYHLVMQGDGNLVLYSPLRALWSSQTQGKGGARIVMQGDGNLVMYNTAGKAIWSTLTNNKGTSTLHLQSDGNLVLYGPKGATWSTRTNGKV